MAVKKTTTKKKNKKKKKKTTTKNIRIPWYRSIKPRNIPKNPVKDAGEIVDTGLQKEILSWKGPYLKIDRHKNPKTYTQLYVIAKKSVSFIKTTDKSCLQMEILSRKRP